MKWLLICLAVILVACTRLIPGDYRMQNFSACGALALFVASRVGLLQSLGITFAALLASDFIQFAQHDYDMMFLPFAPTYIGFAAYALLGTGLLGQSRKPLVIGGVTVLGSVAFFIITNFASWLEPVNGYAQSLSGLIACYTAALPFIQGTLAGDLTFSALLFGAYELLCHPAAKTATAANEI